MYEQYDSTTVRVHKWIGQPAFMNSVHLGFHIADNQYKLAQGFINSVHLYDTSTPYVLTHTWSFDPMWIELTWIGELAWSD